jgi:hypothetical protein
VSTKLGVLVLLVATPAFADPPPQIAPADDGYCDFTTNVANSTKAILYAPEAFVTLGYIDIPPTQPIPSTIDQSFRLLGGLKWKISGLYEGGAHAMHARADCRRHKALDNVQNVTLARALDARLKVYDDAAEKLEAIVSHDKTEAAAHRLTQQEATATQVHADEIRQLTAVARHARAALPPTNVAIAGALVEFQNADDEVERAEGKLRIAQGLDISVRGGIDTFFQNGTQTNPFIVLNVGVNLGIFWQTGANARARAARQKFTREGHERLTFDASAANLRATLDQDRARGVQATALAGDLKRQLDQLDRLTTEESKRFRQTIWFEWVKAEAERAYLDAHIAALVEVLGGAQ